MSWDQIAQQFIEAKGNPQEDGQTALIFGQGADPNDVAAETSRIFLGIQIRCPQCHDHPTDRWKREQFHEFVAFFPRTQLRPILSEGRVRGFEIASFDAARYRRPQQAMNPGRGELEHYMPDLKNPSSQGKLMTPVFFATGRKLSTGKTDGERRTTLADWLTAHEDSWFVKAFVNRIWAELIGEGFYEPIDDLGPDRPCTARRRLATWPVPSPAISMMSNGCTARCWPPTPTSGRAEPAGFPIRRHSRPIARSDCVATSFITC